MLHLCMKRAITDIQRVKTMTRMTVSSVLSEGCFIGPVALVDPDWARCPISVNSSEQFILSEPDPMVIFSTLYSNEQIDIFTWHSSWFEYLSECFSSNIPEETDLRLHLSPYFSLFHPLQCLLLTFQILIVIWSE